MKRKFVVLLFLLGTLTVSAQELNCNVQVVANQIQGTNKQVFKTLQDAVYEFLNNRRWTSKTYSDEERIDCNFLINLKEQKGNRFKGSIQVQSRRPVFNSAYYSTLLNFKDEDFSFEYVEFETLDFNENAIQSNLTAVLAFYATIIVGMDFDSFAPLGGSEYFQKAENIVNQAQKLGEIGWKAFDGRKNRYWLVKGLLNEDFKPLRQVCYRYHRLGLDMMSSKVDVGRREIQSALKTLKEVHQKRPSSFLMQLFFDAKNDELVQIFSKSFGQEKMQLYNLLVELDPSRTSQYEKLVRPKR